MSMRNQKKAFAATVLVGVAGLSLLSGCNWWPFADKSKSDSSSIANSSDVLLSIDGKPALTVEEYEEQLDMARQSNQQIDMLLQMMPNAEREYIFKGISIGKLMKAWGEKEGMDKLPAFQKQRRQLHDAMDLQLYMKAFEETHPLQISDSDVKEFYETKKDLIPGLALTPGGVNIVYARFDSKDKADKFLAKAKDIKDVKKFKADAELEKLSVADATINDKSNFSDALKEVVLGIKSFPRVTSVKVGDNSYWVLFATGKTDAKYRDLKSAEVQQGLRKMIADERKEKQLEQFVEELRKTLNVQENMDYFDKKEGQKRAAMEALAGQDDQESADMQIPAEKL